MFRRTNLLWLVGLSLVAFQPRARGDEPSGEDSAAKATTKFLRIVEDDDGEMSAMETAIVRYERKSADGEPVTVDLVAAIHIADRDYYEALNEQFDDYDVVLYELVAPEGTRVPEGGGESSSVVGMLQRGMQGLLGLEHQLAHVDYQKENFVHADMSPEEFARSMRDKGENMWVLLFRMMGQSIARQAQRGDASGTSDMDLIRAMFDPNRSMAMKRVMARQFEDLDALTLAFEGPDGSTIISERNKVALEVLEEQIDEGNKELAIFYGAGHMPDMEDRLIEMGFQPKKQRWVTAWDMAPQTKSSQPSGSSNGRSERTRHREPVIVTRESKP